jgi:methionyl-tRNA formyltransferase
MNPYPAAYTQLSGKQVKIFKARFEPTPAAAMPGSISSDQKTYLKVACLDGYIHLLDLQMESKKRMRVEEFLRGFKLVE